jgi:hypothetical protein
VSEGEACADSTDPGLCRFGSAVCKLENWPETGFAEIRSVNSPPLAEREFLLLTRCLEDRGRSALRICHHSHAVNIFNLHWRHVEFRTKAFRLCGYLIAIGDQQINLPVRWRPRIAKRRRQNSPKELIVIEKMIVVVGGMFLFLPNSPFEKLLIKSAGAILIGCA